MPFSPSAQFARNVGVVLQCDECLKWRVIYSKTVLKSEQRDELQQLIETLSYTCGSRLQEIERSTTRLTDTIFVKANLSCEAPIEVPIQLNMKIFVTIVALLRILLFPRVTIPFAVHVSNKT